MIWIKLKPEIWQSVKRQTKTLRPTRVNWRLLTFPDKIFIQSKFLSKNQIKRQKINVQTKFPFGEVQIQAERVLDALEVYTEPVLN